MLAGRKASLAGIDTVSSLWNFQSTVHSTVPRSPLRSGSISSDPDPFASFSLAPSPVHTVAHRRSSADQRAALQGVGGARAREASRGSSTHRRQVSFDAGEGAGAREGGGYAPREEVHVEEEGGGVVEEEEEEGGKRRSKEGSGGPAD